MKSVWDTLPPVKLATINLGQNIKWGHILEKRDILSPCLQALRLSPTPTVPKAPLFTPNHCHNPHILTYRHTAYTYISTHAHSHTHTQHIHTFQYHTHVHKQHIHIFQHMHTHIYMCTHQEWVLILPLTPLFLEGPPAFLICLFLRGTGGGASNSLWKHSC